MALRDLLVNSWRQYRLSGPLRPKALTTLSRNKGLHQPLQERTKWAVHCAPLHDDNDDDLLRAAQSRNNRAVHLELE